MGLSDRDMLRFALRRFRRIVRAGCFEPEITASVERTESDPHFLSRGGQFPSVRRAKLQGK